MAPALASWIERFLDHLRVERQLSPHTLNNYRLHLQELGLLAQQLGLAQWSELKAPLVRALVVRLHRGGKLSARSIATKMSSLRSFCDYLVRMAVLKANPARGVVTPKQGRPLPKNLDVDQVYQLLNITDEGDPLAVRDRAIMELFYSSGLRLAELVALNVADLARDDRQLRVLGKGNKERFVYFGSACRKAIDAYLEERKQIELSDNRALFGSRDKNRISVTAVHRLVKKALLQAGLDSTQFSAHKLRHTAATMMLSGGVDVKTVQEVLGHENLNTTQIYTHIESTELKIAAEANPLSKLDFDKS